MNNILGRLYGWFKTFWCQNLDYFLWGYDPASGGYTNQNVFNLIGLITMAVSLIIVLFYYYIFNHPRFCRWWSWLITMALCGFIGLIIGSETVLSRYNNGFIPADLMWDYSTEPATLLITTADCWGVGIANIFIAAIFFIILSFAFKWWSPAAKHVPV